MGRGLRAAAGVTAAAALTGGLAAAWGIGIERYLFTVRRARAEVLEPGRAPLRILHISDIHMAPWQHRKQEWVASLAALEPDLIVNTGDNLGHADGLRGVRAAFAGFEGIPGVFVHGSNDLHAPAPRNPFLYFMGPSRRTISAPRLDTDAMDRFFRDDLGWTDLDNTAATVDVKGLRIAAFGIDDAHRGRERFDLVDKALSTLRRKRSKTALTIGVTHAPYRHVLDEFVDLGADAIFAGHTHGGQVRIPGFGPLVANCDIPLRQARGLSTWRHSARSVPLNVSAGVGHSIYAPVRFACRPEVTLLTLTPRASSSADSSRRDSSG